jgi:hypothetical protein
MFGMLFTAVVGGGGGGMGRVYNYGCKMETTNTIKEVGIDTCDEMRL